jgi:hypothetical protein
MVEIIIIFYKNIIYSFYFYSSSVVVAAGSASVSTSAVASATSSSTLGRGNSFLGESLVKFSKNNALASATDLPNSPSGFSVFSGTASPFASASGASAVA